MPKCMKLRIETKNRYKVIASRAIENPTHSTTKGELNTNDEKFFRCLNTFFLTTVFEAHTHNIYTEWK